MSLSFNEIIKLAPCLRCGAGPGQTCRTANGKRSRYSHSGRDDSARWAWHHGFNTGLAEALRSPESARKALAYGEAHS